MVETAIIRIPIGAVVERRLTSNRWIECLWRPISVVVPPYPIGLARTASGLNGGGIFFAGSTSIELHRTETGSYRENLASGSAKLWVVLRPASTLNYNVLLVTADPGEGEALAEAGTDIVEPVPMPNTIAQIIALFVRYHHVDHPFQKRRRDDSSKRQGYRVLSPSGGNNESG